MIHPNIYIYSKIKTKKDFNLIEENWVILFDEKPIIKIKHAVNDNNLSEEYIKDREAYWNLKKEKHGSKLWNGSVYAVNKILNDGVLKIEFVSCEYKDILFKKEKGIPCIIKQYGLGHVTTHTFTSILPLTTDTEEYILGKISDGTMQSEGVLDLIGGTLNSDETTINNFDDIKKITTQEFEEETNIIISFEHLELKSINHLNGCIFFIFQANFDKKRILHQFEESKEISSLEFFNKKDMVDNNFSKTEDVLFLIKYWKNYLEL